MFDNIASMIAKSISNDRAYADNLRRTLENEFNAAINAKFSALNLGGGASASTAPATDPSVLSRLSAVEQALQNMGASFADVSKFEADSTAHFSAEDQDAGTTHDRLTAVENALSSMADTFSAAAAPLTDLPSTDPVPVQASTDTTATNTAAVDTSVAAGSATNGTGGPAGTAGQGFDPVQGGAGSVSPTGLSPAFGQVQGDTAVTAAPVEIAPGQYVDPHATNPAAVATGAPAPVSGAASQPGGDTSAVAADVVPNAAQATTNAPAPTAANIASPGVYDPASARANPAPFANTEQDAPKAPVINAVPSQMNTSSDAAPVSANTSAAGGVGQAQNGDPTAAS